MNTQFTEIQIAAWRRYESVRQRGFCNMFDPAVQSLARLDRDEHMFCMRNYAALKEAAAAIDAGSAPA